MSMISLAFFTARKAASFTGSGFPTKVTTVLFVSEPISTSFRLMPSTDFMADVISLIFFSSRPSEKLGTHSISPE